LLGGNPLLQWGAPEDDQAGSSKSTGRQVHGSPGADSHDERDQQMKSCRSWRHRAPRAPDAAPAPRPP